MALRRAEVERIAALACLDLTPEEEELFAHQLSRIVDSFDQLQSVQGARATTANPAGGEAETLEADDLPASCLPRQEFLDNAPESIDGFLVVPLVKANAR